MRLADPDDPRPFLRVPCGVCGAPPGYYCSGYTDRHLSRRRKRRECPADGRALPDDWRAFLCVACAWCGAARGFYCRGANGAPIFGRHYVRAQRARLEARGDKVNPG